MDVLVDFFDKNGKSIIGRHKFNTLDKPCREHMVLYDGNKEFKVYGKYYPIHLSGNFFDDFQNIDEIDKLLKSCKLIHINYADEYYTLKNTNVLLTSYGYSGRQANFSILYSL